MPPKGAGSLARALVALAVSCGMAPSPAPVSSRVDESHAARSTPAPAIAWGDRAFDTHALPVIARGGEVAVVAVHDSDGGRGWPNLRLEVRDRNDRVIQTIAVMISNDYETLFPDDKPGAEITRRIEAANRELAKLHGLHDLVAMQSLPIQPPSGDALPHQAIGDDLDVDFAKDHVHIFHGSSTRPFRTADARAWLAPSGRCENPAFLQAVYKAPGINAIIVELGYRGSDTCWEPGNQLHLITW